MFAYNSEKGREQRACKAVDTYTAPPAIPVLPADLESDSRKKRLRIEFLRAAAARGPVVPISTSTWEKIVQQIPVDLINRLPCKTEKCEV